MHNLQVLVLRGIMGIVFGVLLSRFFFPNAPLAFIIGLCVVLVGMAYFTEYLRNKKKNRPPR
ncbi:MAG: hypothetical protein P8X55_00180 [Desulfosarcinaceae bacterium]